MTADVSKCKCLDVIQGNTVLIIE